MGCVGGGTQDVQCVGGLGCIGALGDRSVEVLAELFSAVKCQPSPESGQEEGGRNVGSTNTDFSSGLHELHSMECPKCFDIKREVLRLLP